MKMNANEILASMRSGNKMKPVTWTEKTIFKDGYCYVRNMHTFIEHTPNTIGFEKSPAIIGVQEAINHYGNDWVVVNANP